MQQRLPTIATRRLVLALGLLLAGLGAGVASCGTPGTGGTSGGTSSGATAACTGGVIVNGVCEGVCAPDKCVGGDTCVGNRCVLRCASDHECEIGTQACVAAKEDRTGADITVCLYDGKARAGASCPFGTECAPAGMCPDGSPCGGAQAGTCAAADCQQTVLGACTNGLACYNDGFSACAGGKACALDKKACGALPDCQIGACPDGSACTVPGCTPDKCQPLGCLTRGVADADAYCVSHDCQSDVDCAGGFYCGILHDPRAVCGSTSTKGNDAFCGKTKEPCLDPADFTKNGATYFEGSRCLLRKTCLKRDPCAPCATDLDCSLTPGLRCVTVGPDLRCAADCRKDADCHAGDHCVPNLEDATKKSCVPRFAGGCKGTGKFCEPCTSDEDCSPTGGASACYELDGLTRERACFDASFPVTCTTDNDCPASPSKLHALCLGDAQNVPSTDPFYHHCYLPRNAKTGGYGCW